MINKPQVIDVMAVIFDIGFMLENSSVYQTQVGEQMVALKTIGLRVGLLAITKNPSVFEQVIGRYLRVNGIDIFLIKNTGFITNLIRMANKLRYLHSHYEIRFAYVRGLWGPLIIALANPFRRIKYIYDVRGAIVDETVAIGATRLKKNIFQMLERWGIQNASSVTAVSNYLAEYVYTNYQRRNTHVIPCNVNIDKFLASENQVKQNRQKMGYNESDIVFIYAGGLSHYQQVPAMLSLWKRFLKEPDIRFLILTNDDPHSKKLLVGDIEIFGTRLVHKSLPRYEVPLMLASANIGFMLRNNRELNLAASPVKFAEYLAAGLAIVASPGTGDLSKLIKDNRIGVLVDPNKLDEGETLVKKLIEEIRLDKNAFRFRSRELAQTHYDWKAHKNTYLQLYNT